VDALEESESIGEVYVTVSPLTPHTEEVIENRYGSNVKTIDTAGDNYVGDMVYAVEQANVAEPLMVIMSDLPLITADLIDSIVEEYYRCGKPSMSVFIPLSLCKKVGLRPDTVFNWSGNLIVPTGINILDGSKIREEQEYYNYLLEDPEVALNVNTAEDLQRCTDILEKRQNK
jgi:adenosylcobinamide-phosphate guanylyltransferase